MRKQLSAYSLIAIGIIAFLSACLGGGEKAAQTAETRKEKGEELLP